MSIATIDACCLIDLIASGHAQEVLKACSHDWQLPVAVQGEVRYVRQPDPSDKSKHIVAQVDLDSLISAGAVTICQPDSQLELELYAQYATIFRSDGEAMCLALAKARGWIVATDDRKAIRIGRQAGLTVVSAPEMMKQWADNTNPGQTTLSKALIDIEVLAQFRPNSTMPEYEWWLQQTTGL